MSASDKKKQKKAAMAEGLTQKQRQEAQAAQNAKRKSTIYWAVGIVCALAAVALLVWNGFNTSSDKRHSGETALTVDGQDYTVADLQYYYNEARQQIMQFQTYYGISMGYSTSLSDGAQFYSQTEGTTWADYFRESAVTSVKQVSALCAAAKAEGYTLSEDGQKQIDSYMAQIDAYRLQYRMSRDEYLSQIYGTGVTEKVFLRNMTNSLLASEYSQHHQDSYSYTDADLDAYYAENSASLDSYDYRVFTIIGTPETKTDDEGNTIPATDEEKEAAKQAAEEKAKQAVQEIENAADREQAFIDAAPNYVSDSLKDSYADDPDYSLYTGVVGSTLVSSESYAYSWLTDAERKSGDVTYVAAGSNFRVVLFLNRALNTDPTVDMRHILITPEISDEAETNSAGAKVPTQAEMDAAKAELQAIFNEWKSGETSAERFGELAEKYSKDGRTTDGDLSAPGGLYDHIRPGDMIPGIDNWLFASGRKTGDVEMIEYNDSENGRYFGWHLVYFAGENEPYWKLTARQNKRTSDQSAWLTDLTEAVVTAPGAGMDYVGAKNTVVAPSATPAQ